MDIKQIQGWVGAGLADAVGRFVILSGITAFCARLLPPSDFGNTALILSLVTIFSVCVGAPYEETLAQRKRVRRVHVEAALAASLSLAVILIVASVGVGLAMDDWWESDGFVVMLPVCATLLLAHGPISVATALARRQRKFYAINASNLVGHLAGAGIAVALGLMGAGIWTLIGLRVGIAFATAATLLTLLRLPLRPRWNWPVIRELNRFAVFIMLMRVVENLSFLIYNFAVGGLFGVTVLGYANMAMRLVEPIRGAVIAIMHNLSVSFLGGVARNRERLGEEVARISAETNVVTAPVFMGLAAVSPVLVPILAGPGWEEAVEITMAQAVGGMVALPAIVVMSSLSVVGLPKYGVFGNAVGLVALVIALGLSVGSDPLFVGVAKAVADAGQFSFLVLVGGPLVMLGRAALLRRLAGPWLAALLMALAVTLLVWRLEGTLPPAAILCLAVPTGVAVYAVLLLVLARPHFERLLQLLSRGRFGGGLTPEPAE